jgi:hypothetical protein
LNSGETKEANLRDINSCIEMQNSLFICSSSFEKRCLSVAEHIDALNGTFIFYNIDPSEKEPYYNLNELKRLLPNNRIVDIKLSDPLLTRNSTVQALKEINNSISSFVIDITTFNRESLLILLFLLKEIHPHKTITCVYACAKNYCSDWLTMGVKESRAILGYHGSFSPLYDTHIVLLLGYEANRARWILEEFNPVSISIGYAPPNDTTVEENKMDGEDLKDTIVKIFSQTPINEFVISCKNPYIVQEVIHKNIENIKEKNILIFPLNNKISTIGAGLEVLKYSRAQIIYTQPVKYNYKEYSVPGDTFYAFDIDWDEIMDK